MGELVTHHIAYLKNYLEESVLLPAVYVYWDHILNILIPKRLQQVLADYCLSYARHAMYEEIPSIPPFNKRLYAQGDLPLLCFSVWHKLWHVIIIQWNMVSEKSLPRTEHILEYPHIAQKNTLFYIVFAEFSALSIRFIERFCIK